MAAGRIKLVYKCKECKHENYIGKKNKTEHSEKTEIKKHCSNCNKHTLHTEKGKLH
ncbi:MAG: 50S ribosomal protein L33 [Mycoplasmataceae bacterium]|nr:50S ribosomal protein L33 [Mycoplasmataceae bacterium]